jgi:hypothetical protein
VKLLEKKMLEIEKWSQNKHPFLAAFSQVVVFLADGYAEVIDDIKEGNISTTKFPYPELSVWQKYYISSAPVFEFLSDVFLGNKNVISGVRRELGRKRIILELSGKEKESFLKKKVAVPVEIQQKNIVVRREKSEGIYSSSVHFLKKELDDGNSEFVKALKAKITSTDELSFLARVWMPCFYFYGEAPAQLLRKARGGDLKSLESLIRVDSSVIFDRRIAAFLHGLRNKSARKHSELMDCISKSPKGHTSRQKIKCFLAGVVWLMSKGMNLQLTEPEIRGLFDAVARDKGEGEIDVDLPESPHGLYQAMQREMKIFLPST